MILYNVTIKIDHSVHKEWLDWMKKTHIPDVMNTGYFHENKLCRIMGVDEADGFTYSIQYLMPDIHAYQSYQAEAAPSLQKEHTDKFKGKFVAFRTVLKVLSVSKNPISLN